MPRGRSVPLRRAPLVVVSILASVAQGPRIEAPEPAVYGRFPDVTARSGPLPPPPGGTFPDGVYRWNPASTSTLASRIPPPAGFRRRALTAGSFGAWLRGLPVREGRPDVRLHDGSFKKTRTAHHAVIDIDVGERDLQQCADSIIRLRAEYLLASGCADEIVFNFTSGDPAPWTRWESGERPIIEDNRAVWKMTHAPGAGYDSFRRYLDVVFTYAGTASLARELTPVADPRHVEPGDVFIEGGFPGHAVLVVDAATDERGDRVFLLAQGYMPAQEMHVLVNPMENDIDPWYRARRTGPLVTPEWLSHHESLRRFPADACGVPRTLTAESTR